jgi:hypothetical protein
LAMLEFPGYVSELRLDCKDPADLHVRDPAVFGVEFEKALKKSLWVDLSIQQALAQIARAVALLEAVNQRRREYARSKARGGRS